MTETNTIKQGVKDGKTVAIFCGVHGNEKAGVDAVKKVLEDVEVVAGKVYFVFANPDAIEKNVRYVEKNLNRCFLKDNSGDAMEDKRAIELMKILDDCEILLDLHASNNTKSTPFIICEKNGYEIAEKFDFEIISSGWDALEPGGSDGYMNNIGKIGICLECGSVLDRENGSTIAEKSIYQFLKYTGNILNDVEYSKKEKKFINVIRVEKQKTLNFSFTKSFEDFEKLEDGKVFAIDGDRKYIAGNNECIIFPNPNKKIGEEVFLIGKLKN